MMSEDKRIEAIMKHYKCSFEDAVRYLALRDEGHTSYQAAVMAGIADADY